MAAFEGPNRFTIACDIDDTLTPYTQTFLKHHAQEMGVSYESLKHPTSYDMGGNGWPGITDTASYLEYHNEYVRRGMFSNSLVLPHAVEALTAAREAGAYVKIVTTRFCSKNPVDMAHVIGETGKFLLNNEIPFDEFMISSTKDEIHADVYIDDSPSNIAKFRKAGNDAIVPNTTLYTAGVAAEYGYPLMQDWIQGKDMLLQMIDKFNQRQVEQEPLFLLTA